MTRVTPAHGQDGVSLIELVMTIAIIGLSFVALLGGLAAAVAGSGQQRQRAALEAVLRGAADDVRDPSTAPYAECATAYPVSAPDGYTATATVVGFWNPDPAINRYEAPPCPSTPDSGLQLLELHVATVDGMANQRVHVVKRR